MAEPVKKDDALAAAVREAFQRHMENARLASLSARPSAISAEKKLAVAGSATVRQIELRAEPRRSLQEVPQIEAERKDLPRLPSVEDSPLPALPKLETVPAEIAAEPSVDVLAPESGNGLVALPPPVPVPALPRPGVDASVKERSLLPPTPANDREARREASRLRDRPIVLPPPEGHARPDEAPNSPALDERRPDTLHASRPGIAPPVPRARAVARRDVPQPSVGVHFGTGSRREVQERSSSRWIVMAALGAASLLCIGIGGYVWLNASAPPPKSGAVEGRASPAPSEPQTNVAAAPAAKTPEAAPPAKMAAAPIPSTPSPANPPQAAAEPVESPLSARTVQTTTIKLDTIDLAVQDARERLGMGDVAAARLILERFRDGGDPRALFALAETFDPAIVKAPGLADAQEATSLYEAAGRAGSADSAERLARLQTEKAN